MYSEYAKGLEGRVKLVIIVFVVITQPQFFHTSFPGHILEHYGHDINILEHPRVSRRNNVVMVRE